MRDVFLSYDHDDRLRAERFHHAITRCGWTVWRDVVDLLPGQSWNDVIEKELTDAGAVLVLWSKNAVNSKFVRDEAELGLELGRLIPVTLDGQQPKLGMRQIQFEDMSSWDGVSADHPGLIKVLSAIGQLLKGGHVGGVGQETRTVAPPDVQKSDPPRVGQSSFGKRMAYIAAGAVLVSALTVGAALLLLPGKSTSDGTNTTSTPPPPKDNGEAERADRADREGVKPPRPEEKVVKGPRENVVTKDGRRPPIPVDSTAKVKPDGSDVVTPTKDTPQVVAAGPGCTTLIAATRKQSDVASLFYDLGKCHYDEGRFNDAVRAYKSAVELNEQPKYYEGLGLAKWKNNQASQGIKDLTSAIELSKPNDPNLYGLLESRGQIYLASRNYQAAQDDYDRATQLNSKSKSGWLGLAAAAEKTMSLDIAASAKVNADAIP